MTVRSETSASDRRSELRTREDIIRLVDGFYDKVRADGILGPIFNDIARVDWATHLPKMYDFWEAVLFGTAQFKGNPLAVHRSLATRAPMDELAFGRWLELFHGTVDELFTGFAALEAKARAVRIATTMQYHIAIDTAGQSA